MTVNEMIEALQDYADNVENGGDMEVRLMTQEAWPFENTVHGVCLSSEIVSEDENQCEEEVDDDEEAEDEVVYIVEGSQLGYGNKNAWAC